MEVNFILKIIKDLKNSISFLTRIPINHSFENFSEVSKAMWLFPFVGFIVGLIAGLLGILLLEILPSVIVGFIILGFLIYITGAHHADGLFDFGDGLMVVGSPERKISVMHDVSIGAGGFALGFIVLTITGFSIGYLGEILLLCIIFSEINAEYSIHIACCFGKSANTKTAHDFIIQNSWKDYIKSTLLVIFLTSVILILIGHHGIIFFNYIDSIFPNELALIVDMDFWQYSILLLLISIILPLITSLIFNKIGKEQFNGLTGDVLGALHEITRMANLLIYLIIFT